jgi:hypothetical protein
MLWRPRGAALHFAWALVLFAIAVWIPQVLDSSGWIPISSAPGSPLRHQVGA